MNVYKIFETVNNFYYYVVSHIDDADIVLEHTEHYSAHHPEKPMNTYLNSIGWDVIDCEKVDSIKPIDVINNTIPPDEKCMNNSQKFQEFIVEAKPKAKRAPKPKAEQIEKPKPKPRGEKAQVQVKEI